MQDKIKVSAIFSCGTNWNPMLNKSNRIHAKHIHEVKKKKNSSVEELFIYSFIQFTDVLLDA